jgi:hypothetical protein
MGLFSNMVKSLQAASIDDVICKIEEETTIPASLVTPLGDEKNDKRVQNFICELLKKEYGAENVNTDYSLGGALGLKSEIDMYNGKIAIIAVPAYKLTSAPKIERLVGKAVCYMHSKYDENVLVLVVGKSSEKNETIEALEKIIDDEALYFLYKETI